MENLNQGSIFLEDAVYETVSCRPSRLEPGAFQIHDQRVVQQGIVVLYTARCPSSDPRFPPLIPTIGYAFLKQHKNRWFSFSSSSIGVLSPATPDEFVRTGNGNVEESVIKYGRVLNPEVKLVQITLENGRIQRDVPRNGMFVISFPSDIRTCELQLLDTDGNIMQRHPLQFEHPCQK
jgi:hypothetical protein